ncbi:MAG: hypothetical protein PHX70_11335 [Clostridium sp.]|nr:hypothetical protein [Clostridium sp.]
MNVDSIMNVYDMNSFWNDMNSNSNSSQSSVFLTNNLDSTIQQDYNQMDLSGQTNSSELQDIFQQTEPDYGISLTYNQLGSLSMPTNTALQYNNGMSYDNSNISSLLQSDVPSEGPINENVLSQYTSIEDGTFTPNISSILASNPFDMYNNMDSLLTNSTLNTNNILDAYE